jgi:flagellar P-ring protein precursor FlgI
MFKINIILIIFFLFASNLFGARIKDIAVIEGVSGVQVVGYGLVSGLNQSGDNQQTTYTVQSVSNMLKRFGLTVPERNPRIRNVAAVMVTATIPAFMKAGSKVDVVVSSIGDANSLQGGVLLMTPLSTADGTIVGMAQGSLSVGGYDFNALGSKLGKNISTTGRVPNGLFLDISFNREIIIDNKIRISLREPDFTTASRISQAVNSVAGLANSAQIFDAGTVEVTLPVGTNNNQAMELIARIEVINVISDPIARVVINERTGTVVVGGNVELLPAVIAHAGLEISIQKQVIVPQPAPFTIRPPQIAETAEITTREELRESRTLVVQGPTVQDIANALNLLQVNPRDLISIFQALKESGSLQGELIIQ